MSAMSLDERETQELMHEVSNPENFVQAEVGMGANENEQVVGGTSEAIKVDQEPDIHKKTELGTEELAESKETDIAQKSHIASTSSDGEASALAKIDAERQDVLRDNDSVTTEGASTDATGSNSDGSPCAAEDPSGNVIVRQDSSHAPTAVRVLHVRAALPHDLSFFAPPGCVPGQALTVQGPHGPLQVQAPPNVRAGQQVTMRLGSPLQHEVFVPAGAKPGQRVTFLGANDEQLEAVVPPGKRPGQVFHVSPPVVMIPVPLGALVGDQLAFVAPNGQVMMVPVPPDVPHGQYLSVQYVPQLRSGADLEDMYEGDWLLNARHA